MRYISVTLLSLLCFFLSSAAGNDIEGNNTLKYQISLERGPYISGEAVPCRLLVHNGTDTLQKFRKPQAAEINLKVSGPGGTPYQAVWQNNAMEEKEPLIALRSKCTLDIVLGSFIIEGDKKDTTALPAGRYFVSGTWATREEETSRTSTIVGNQEVNVVEYPMHVKLQTSKRVYTIGKPAQVEVSFENAGMLPIAFLNYFLPHHDHFAIILKPKEGLGGLHLTKHDTNVVPIRRMAAITPDADITGWITLQPGERLRVAFDAKEYLKDEGIYSFRVVYKRSIVVHDPKGKPYYTKQRRWESNMIELELVAEKK